VEYDVQYVLSGERAYQGLTAVMIGSDGACPNTRVTSSKATLRAAPAPQTGQ